MQIIRKVLRILKWLTLIVYLGILTGFACFAYQWKSKWMYPQLNKEILLPNSILFGVIPIIILVVLFLKVDKIWKFIVQAVLQGVFIFCLPIMALILVGFVPGSVWSSVTDDMADYYVFEEEVEEHINLLNLDILPTVPPQDIEEPSYSYHFWVAIDSLLIIDTSWQYLKEEDYEWEKERILQKQISETYEENGYRVCKIRVSSGINDNNMAEFGYDDKTHAVFYRIRGMW